MTWMDLLAAYETIKYKQQKTLRTNKQTGHEYRQNEKRIRMEIHE